jgi:hypothetical protein
MLGVSTNFENYLGGWKLLGLEEWGGLVIMIMCSGAVVKTTCGPGKFEEGDKQ